MYNGTLEQFNAWNIVAKQNYSLPKYATNYQGEPTAIEINEVSNLVQNSDESNDYLWYRMGVIFGEATLKTIEEGKIILNNWFPLE